MVEDLISTLISDELESIASEVLAGRRGHILKSLDERGTAQALIRAQYSGRYPFELLQNANDAAVSKRGTGLATGHVRFELTPTALLVADRGAGFGDDEVRAICGLGRSSKDPRKSIGYKGLGFKSVGEITDTPQIVSDRYRFMFDADRARASVLDRAGEIPETQRIPVYAFPFEVGTRELGEDTHRVQSLLQEGFCTVIRLPLRAGVSPETVEQHLRSTLNPRLLLFLDATQTLEVAGRDYSFSATALRERADPHMRVLLETDGQIQEWIAFSQRLSIPNPDLILGLGEEWRVVEQVSVGAAARVAGDQIAADRVEPLHVYFPTEEVVGLPLVLSGDFALELDRRHIARSPETAPYNEWLRDQLGAFLAHTVAPSLSEMFAHPSTLSALVPRVAAAGFGVGLMSAYTRDIETSRFVPAEDGRRLLPGEARMLPASLPKDSRSRSFLMLDQLGAVVVLEAQADEKVRHFLVEELDCLELGIDATLEALAPPDADFDAFAGWLVEWADSAPRGRLGQALANVRCVKTTDGAWLAPTHGVFFPREREAPDLPQSLTVPIAVVPDVDGYRSLIESAGVRPFRWREVIFERLMPLLSDEGSSESERETALLALQRYWESEPRGDREVEARVGSVLVRAARVDGSLRSWQPARSVYFSSPWLDNDSLERIYGPFREPEFLVQLPPDDSEERRIARGFLEWLGVGAGPRVDEKVADRGDQYMWHHADRHPHRSAGDLWHAWQDSEQVESAAECSQGHPASQQLRSSYWLDRFGELAGSQDAARLSALFGLISEGWAARYRNALQATFYCQHSQHSGERERHVSSLLGFALRSTAWVVAERGDSVAVQRPSDVWRAAPDVPARVLAALPILPDQLDTEDGAALGRAIGVVDAARPQASDLIAILKRMAAEQVAEVPPAGDSQAILAARWVMRSLDDAIAREGISTGDLAGVPLLARFEGVPGFHTDAYASDDPFLTETWSDDVPVLDADRGLSRLVMAAGLRRLENAVVVTPRPLRTSDGATESTSRYLAAALPYVAAVAVDAVPSRSETTIPRLQRLAVVVCESLGLELSLEAMSRTRSDAVSYISSVTRGSGRTQAVFGTAFLELGDHGEVNWFAAGPQLAEFLEVPNLGDAFTLILSSAEPGRVSYLRSRGLGIEEVRAAADALGQPIAPIPDAIKALERAWNSSSDEALLSDAHSEPAVGDAELDARSPSQAAPDEEPEYPEIDFGTVVGEDAAVVVDGPRPDSSAQPAERDSAAHRTGIPWERHGRATRTIGRRGEEAAMHYERRRLESLGYEPTAAEWVSNRDELSPYDIRSLDDDGQVIFIEVKATVDSEPSEPFEISAAELEFAARKGSRYWIYRVVDTGTASPRIVRFRDPLRLLSVGGASIRLSGARMAFRLDESPVSST